MKRILAIFLFMVLVLMIFSSCKKSAVIPGSADTTEPPQWDSVSVGESAPDFEETDSRGNPVSLQPHEGKVIILTFSTMWCSPCRSEAPELVKLYSTYRTQGLEILQCIFEDEYRDPADQEDLIRWINSYNINFIVFNDPDQSTVRRYGFRTIPHNYVIDRSGVIRFIITGNSPYELEQAVIELL